MSDLSWLPKGVDGSSIMKEPWFVFCAGMCYLLEGDQYRLAYREEDGAWKGFTSNGKYDIFFESDPGEMFILIDESATCAILKSQLNVYKCEQLISKRLGEHSEGAEDIKNGSSVTHVVLDAPPLAESLQNRTETNDYGKGFVYYDLELKMNPLNLCQEIEEDGREDEGEES